MCRGFMLRGPGCVERDSGVRRGRGGWRAAAMRGELEGGCRATGVQCEWRVAGAVVGRAAGERRTDAEEMEGSSRGRIAVIAMRGG